MSEQLAEVAHPSHPQHVPPDGGTTEAEGRPSSTGRTIFFYPEQVQSIPARHLVPYTILLIMVASAWLISGHWAYKVLLQWPAPSTLAYCAVACLQVYFLAVSVKPAFPRLTLTLENGLASENANGNQNVHVASPVIMANRPGTISDSDLDLGNDKYTNRETAKLALILFPLLAGALYMLFYGFQQASPTIYVTFFPLTIILLTLMMAVSGRIDMLYNAEQDYDAYYRIGALVPLLFATALLYVSPVLAGTSSFDEYFSGAFWTTQGFVIGAAFLFALFWTILLHRCEHTGIKYPLIFAFCSLYTMVVGWVPFVFFYEIGIETIAFPPSTAPIYTAIMLVIFLGIVGPLYVIQLMIKRTSVIYVFSIIGASAITIQVCASGIMAYDFILSEFVAGALGILVVILANVKFTRTTL